MAELQELLRAMAVKAAGRLSFGLLRSIANYWDGEAMRGAAKGTRSFVFDVASCIHPSIVPLLNEGFAPTAEEVAAASRLIARRSQKSRMLGLARSRESEFVDAPVLECARVGF